MSSEPQVFDDAGKARFQSPAEEEVVVRATGDETGGAYDMVEVTIPPGPGVTPLHIHHDNDEAMYVIEGEVTVKLGEERRELSAGSYAIAPRGLAHTYRNSGDSPARVLFIYTPGNHWRYLEEAGERGPVEDERDIEELQPVLEAYGIEMVGPPLGPDPEA